MSAASIIVGSTSLVATNRRSICQKRKTICSFTGNNWTARSSFARAGFKKLVSAPSPLKRERMLSKADGSQMKAAAEENNDLLTAPTKENEKPSQMEWDNQWYPIAFTEDLPTDAPYAFTLLEQPLVVWKTPGAEGEWRIFRDACPHRLVPLSEGRVDESTGSLECPYHGWQFGQSGTCSKIPEGGDCSNTRACATVYPAVEKQGMLFVRPRPMKRRSDNTLEPEVFAEEDFPLVPELEEEETVTMDVARDFPYDYSLLLENLLDVGHVHFTHHATISRRENAPVIELQVQNRTSEGFTGRNLDDSLGARDTLFQAPTFMRHTIDNWEAKGRVMMIVVYAIPIAPGKCRLLNRQVFKFKKAMPRRIIGNLPKWLFHTSNNVILEDDVIFLHKQQKEFVKQGGSQKPVSQVYHMPSSSDAFVVALHIWLNRHGGGGPFGPICQDWLSKIGPELSQDDLLERYHSHTKHCVSCSRHLNRLKIMEKICLLGSFISGAVATVLAAVSSLWAATSFPDATVTNYISHGAQNLFTKTLQLIPPHSIINWVGKMVALTAVFLGWYFFAKQQQEKYIRGKWPPPRNVVA